MIDLPIELILLGWSVGVVSLADNIIRPWILSGRVNLSPLVLFFALLGGVEVFGPLGIFLGPLIVSLAVTFGAMFFAELRQQEELDAKQPGDPTRAADAQRLISGAGS